MKAMTLLMDMSQSQDEIVAVLQRLVSDSHWKVQREGRGEWQTDRQTDRETNLSNHFIIVCRCGEL